MTATPATGHPVPSSASPFASTAVAGRGRGVRARGHVEIASGPGGLPRLRQVRTQPPLGVRLAGGVVHLLGTAAGPMGGDDLGMSVHVHDRTRVTVRSVAATVVLPGDGRPSRHDLDLSVGAGAQLHWMPEPMVVAAGSRHRTTTTVRLAHDASLVLTEQVVLGRSGEPGGALSSTMRIERAGEVVLHHGLDTTQRWSSPSVAGGARATGLVTLVGAPARRVAASAARAGVAVQRLHEDVVVVVAVADDALSLHHLLADAAESALVGDRARGLVTES